MPRSTRRVAVVACRASPDAGSTDIYPDRDWPFLETALGDAGVDASLIAWDATGVDWAAFDLAVIRSTWDSVDRPDEYLAWARRTARVTELVNPLAAVEWNLDKTYLRRLQERGVAVVPTQWVSSAAGWTPPAYEFVVKPSISGGGRQTARYAPDEVEVATAHVDRLLLAGRTVMVQPYLAGVESEGEVKLVFVGGDLSHAVRAGALLEAGAGVLERPWERPVSTERVAPSPIQLRTARAVLAAVDAEVGAPLLYSRVDLVAAADGEPLLAEVELIDPSLFLRLAPEAAASLVAAIGSR